MATNFDNSGIYFKTFWQPCINSSTPGDYYSPATKIIFIFVERVYSISIYFPAV